MAAYLKDCHVVRLQTVSAVATEVGMSRQAVGSALTRHGVDRTAHATSRGRLEHRVATVASRFGFLTLDDYLADRRAAGHSWQRIARECGQPETWVRRRAHPG